MAVAALALNLLLILGAMDPEMQEFETLAAACGVPTVRATSAGLVARRFRFSSWCMAS